MNALTIQPHKMLAWNMCCCCAQDARVPNYHARLWRKMSCFLLRVLTIFHVNGFIWYEEGCTIYFSNSEFHKLVND